MPRARSKPLWRPGVNVFSTEGVGPLMRKPDVNQQEPPEVLDVQPTLMVVVIDEADPHANDRSSYSGQYGVLYVARPDDVRDGDKFDYEPTLDGVVVGQKFRWGVLGASRWNQNHALTQVNFGVKQFRIRKGG
jgi:hypothetical protein